MNLKAFLKGMKEDFFRDMKVEDALEVMCSAIMMLVGMIFYAVFGFDALIATAGAIAIFASWVVILALEGKRGETG